ncbi:hypothetical protein BGZ83_009212 [Gryganskiella cystojenkinii]|nr:hypothetical protein BGZ83_009212 [Gryganskiella cystojenkinii]
MMMMMNSQNNNGPFVGDYFSRPSTPPSSASHSSSFSSFSASIPSSYSHHLLTPSTPITPPAVVIKEELSCPSRPIYSPASTSVSTFPAPQQQTPSLSSLNSILTTPLTPTLPHLQISTSPRSIAAAGQSSSSASSNSPYPTLKNEPFSPRMHHLLHRHQHNRRRSVSMSSDEQENGQEYSRESSPTASSYHTGSHPHSRTHSHNSVNHHHPMHLPFGGPHYGHSHHGHHGLVRPAYIKHEPYIKHEMLMSPSSPTSCSPLSPSSPHSGGGGGNNSSQLLLCPVCSRAFKPSKNQNCNLRRHLKNVHNMSPTMHPRKCKWDSLPDGRVKDDKDRKERTRKSKRLWARKFRQRRKVEEAAVVLSMLSQAL